MRNTIQKTSEAENMLRLYRLGMRIEAIAALYHRAPATIRQRIGNAKKNTKG